MPEAPRPFRETDVLALDLVNTWDPYLADPERLPDLPALRRFLAEHTIAGPVRHADLDACRALRARLRAIVEAPSPATFDALGAHLRCVPVLGDDWRLGLKAGPAATLAQRLGVTALAELAELLRRHGPERMRQCAGAPCRDAFVDTSRNGRRRYCSQRCANRVNAAAHRARQASKGRRPARGGSEAPTRQSDLNPSGSAPRGRIQARWPPGNAGSMGGSSFADV